MDAREVLAALEADRGLRDEARRLMVSDEVLHLPEVVAESGRQIDALRAVVAEHGRQIDALRSHVEDNDRQIAENGRQIAENGRQIAENGRQIAALQDLEAERGHRIDDLRAMEAERGRRIDELAKRADVLDGDLAGMRLEDRYRLHPYGYFGKVLRKAHALDTAELATLLDTAVTNGAITQEQAVDVGLADLVVHGRDDGGELILVVEVSRTIRPEDVRRAVVRAGHLARAGHRARPAVAGNGIDPEATAGAESGDVIVVLDGRPLA